MLLIDCKIHLEFNWTKNCIMSAEGNDDGDIPNATFEITNTKLYIPIVN